MLLHAGIQILHMPSAAAVCAHLAQRRATKPRMAQLSMSFNNLHSGSTMFQCPLFASCCSDAVFTCLVHHHACSDVRFNNADSLEEDSVMVLSSDDDGWLHMQVNLARLNNTAPTACASASGASIARVHGSAGISLGTSSLISGVPSFDRIVFSDVSGMGFHLQLDDVRLLVNGADVAPRFAASAFTPILSAGGLLPVFGQDLFGVRWIEDSATHTQSGHANSPQPMSREKRGQRSV